MRYSPERKETVLQKNDAPLQSIDQAIGPERRDIRGNALQLALRGLSKGLLMPDGDSSPSGWNARDKFAAVVESASLNEHELGEYCRKKGIYAGQLEPMARRL